jgi:hypothetical protein
MARAPRVTARYALCASDHVKYQQADDDDTGHAEHPQYQSLAHSILSSFG